MKTQAPSKRMSVNSLLRAVQRRKLFVLIPLVVLTPAIGWYVMRLPQKYKGLALVGSTPIMQDRLTFS